MSKNCLPCLTWVSTGTCKYGNRCDFIHPDDLKYTGNYTTINSNNKNNNKNNKYMCSDDSFYYDNDKSNNKNTYFSHINNGNKKRLKIFEDLSNTKEDIFSNKCNTYSGLSLYKNFE